MDRNGSWRIGAFLITLLPSPGHLQNKKNKIKSPYYQPYVKNIAAGPKWSCLYLLSVTKQRQLNYHFCCPRKTHLISTSEFTCLIDPPSPKGKSPCNNQPNFWPSVSSLFLVPSVYKKSSFCTASWSSLLFAKLDATQFMNH